MTFYVEIEDSRDFGLDYEKILQMITEAVLDHVNCPYEASVSLTITDDETIKELNNEYRNIDASTDVLSFPMNEFIVPACFNDFETSQNASFDPDSGELLLGDIVVSLDHVIKQAEAYGHTIFREFSFLIAHSVLHLIGYDHMSPDEEEVMFSLQEEILNKLKIYRGSNNV